MNLIYWFDMLMCVYVLWWKLFGLILLSVYVVDCEYCVIVGLYLIGFLVLWLYGLCEDVVVIGVVFYVMEMVEGWMIWDGLMFGVMLFECIVYYEVMVDMFVVFYNIDYVVVGFGEYGKFGNYFEC